jgi:hypothetical protein
MAEIFPRGFTGLRDWISRETASRFGAEGSENAEGRQAVFDEMCVRLYAKPHRVRAWAFLLSGKSIAIPVSVWMRPEAERRKIAATGLIEEFWNPEDLSRYYSGRIALPANFTLAPVPARQEPYLPPDIPIPSKLPGKSAWALRSVRNNTTPPPQTAGGRPTIAVPQEVAAVGPKCSKDDLRRIIEDLAQGQCPYPGGYRGLVADIQDKNLGAGSFRRIIAAAKKHAPQLLNPEPGRPKSPKPRG